MNAECGIMRDEYRTMLGFALIQHSEFRISN